MALLRVRHSLGSDAPLTRGKEKKKKETLFSWMQGPCRAHQQETTNDAEVGAGNIRKTRDSLFFPDRKHISDRYSRFPWLVSVDGATADHRCRSRTGRRGTQTAGLCGERPQKGSHGRWGPCRRGRGIRRVQYDRCAVGYGSGGGSCGGSSGTLDGHTPVAVVEVRCGTRGGLWRFCICLATTAPLAPPRKRIERLIVAAVQVVAIDMRGIHGAIVGVDLAFVWYGATSNWSYRKDPLQLDVGVNANTYSRDHSAYIPPDRLYLNTGHKQDASGFIKAAYTVGGRATLFGDIQARRAEFRYTPDENANITERSISWSFLNPKAGITYQVSGPLALFASLGQNTREPARNDMFAGFDNLDDTNVEFVGDLSRVKPETVRDLEVGLTYRTSAFDARANVYSMDFRNEIAPIGALSYIGSPLRKNVGSSYRRGIEADVVYRASSALVLQANASASKNQISQYTDSTGETPVTYRNVEPLLTPRFTTFERAEYRVVRDVSLAVETQYTSRSFLQNTSDDRFVLPAALTLNASASFRRGRAELVVRGNNLTDNKKYGSGYASDGDSYYFVVPPRNLFATLKLAF